jgi:hypothetical protein
MKTLVRIFLLAALVVACTAPSLVRAETKITKVKKFHLTDDGAKFYGAIDRMVTFERQHLLWGAVTTEERRARYGEYFTFMWKTKDKSTPATLRFEYRQKGTTAEVLVKEIDIPKVKGSNTTQINVVGDEYATNGQVMSWRASIVRGGETVASSQSFLWE